MNAYCIYLKKRKNKPYCNLIKKEIMLFRCRECDNKEYQKNDTIISKKNAQLQRNKSPKNTKMHNKSKKLIKLERNRFSVFTDDLTSCYLCGRKKDDLHEIFGGRNRRNSMNIGFILPLCRECHSLNQIIYFLTIIGTDKDKYTGKSILALEKNLLRHLGVII